MRRMSFRMTQQQIRDRTKTVTRRQGWINAKPGDIVQPVVQAQGLKKGQRQKPIGRPIRFVDVRREAVQDITDDDIMREGFQFMGIWEFIGMYCQANHCRPQDLCTRIEFEYLDGQNSTSE